MTTFTVKKTNGTKIADIIDETKGCFVTNVRFDEDVAFISVHFFDNSIIGDIAKKVRELDK